MATSAHHPDLTNGHMNGTNGFGLEPQAVSTPGTMDVQCGPLLNYRSMSNADGPHPIWHGSVLLVTNPGAYEPTLYLRPLGSGTQGASEDIQATRAFHGEKIYEDPKAAFWRFLIDLPLQEFEARWGYHIRNIRHTSTKENDCEEMNILYVPSATQSMRIMFHSCNGFSLGTDEEAWSGCALWNDVLRIHKEKPFHVMIGGGDQIYNDNIRVDGPLKEWCEMKNPIKRREYPFPEDLRSRCDDFYFNNYVRWYNTEPFSIANSTIPQINIWDDHDIIDGFGSYTDHFMQCAVFRGIGGVAHKYYLLFQHHLPPPQSTFTTDAPSTTTATDTRPDPVQLKNTFVMKERKEDPSYVLGRSPGPYVQEPSRSIYTQLGARIALLGIDARMERTRHQINYPETYEMLFDHVERQLSQSAGRIKHFILLLGVPIAYPRLQWLENIFHSPLMGPIKLMNKRFGFAGALFNQFDGNIDLMDDLDDHYTAHHHKKERKILVQRLQLLAHKHSVRVTILGGDVHLGALGRFYANPNLNVLVENDPRYMANVISSAITNHPPPAAIANLLASRNKIHHLDHDTDETLLNLFDRDPIHKDSNKTVEKKTSASNHCTMPSRNYAIITESHDWSGGASINDVNRSLMLDGEGKQKPSLYNNKSQSQQHHNHSRKAGNPRDAIHEGEAGCGTTHPAANGVTHSELGGLYGLDVVLRVEIDHSDRQGKTEGYGLNIPSLDVTEGSKFSQSSAKEHLKAVANEIKGTHGATEGTNGKVPNGI